MKKKATGSSGKKSDAGLKRTAKGRVEKDIDDLVHSAKEEKRKELEGEDPDDAVHRPYKPNEPNKDNKLEDPDDLVHGYDDEDENK